MKKFIKKYYRIMFRPALLKGILFLLLFVSGLVRYRFALVFVLGGLVSVVRQLLETNGVQTKGKWKPVNQMLLFIWMMAVWYDIKYGQIYPKYHNLPMWESAVIAATVYSLGFLFYMKEEWLVRKLSGGAVFSICPNCGFANIQVVEQCKKCGYKYGMTVEPLATEAEIPEELKKEVEDYRAGGLLRNIPADVLIGLKLSTGEHVLMAMKTGIFYYVGTEKNNMKMPAGWFFMTTKKIVCYYGLKGWENRDFIPYENIKSVEVVKGKVAYTYKDKLEIDIGEDSYQFLFGVSTRKLCTRIFTFDTTNAPILREIMRCIDKRKPGITQLGYEFDKNDMSAEPLVMRDEDSEELKKEIGEYSREGLLSEVPKEVIVILKLTRDEQILMAMKSLGLFRPNIKITRDNRRARPGWFFITTRKIAYYTRPRGYPEIDSVSYYEIKNMRIAEERVGFKKYKCLIVDTENHSYKLSPRTLKWTGIRFKLFTEPIVQTIVRCINKRKQGIAQSGSGFNENQTNFMESISRE